MTEATKQKKRIGRPPKYHETRISLSILVTQKMYDILVARREDSGRSLSGEIEMILEKAFFPMDPKLAASIRKMPPKPKAPTRGFDA